MFYQVVYPQMGIQQKYIFINKVTTFADNLRVWADEPPVLSDGRNVISSLFTPLLYPPCLRYTIGPKPSP